MDTGHRREVRNARRLRRHQRSGADGNDAHEMRTGSAAVGGRFTPPPPNSAPGVMLGAGAAASGAVGHRTSVVASRDEAQRLSERMKQQRQVKSRADQIVSQREALIRERYAPNAIAATAHGPSQQQPQASAYAFDKDDLLANLIGESRANFLKLDHDLTEDHTIATHRLHTSVFSHAKSFLLLFRDVDRASDLVEALKANVQGTKAAISSISKYSANFVAGASISSAGKLPGSATADVRGCSAGGGSVFSAALGGSPSDGDPRRFARPSLVSRRITQRYASGGSSDMAWLNDGDVDLGWGTGGATSIGSSAAARSSRTTTWGSTVHRSSVVDEEGAVADGGADAVTTNAGASRPTTRGLNVSSVRQWRHIIGMGTGLAARGSAGDREVAESSPTAPGRQWRGGSGLTAKSRASTGHTTTPATSEKEAADTTAFVDILREEVNQLLTERRHVDAAELLYRLADEATAKGCVPFLLDLEAALVSSVITNVVKIPITPMYVESLHVPLIQLLLRFGRSRSAAAVYLTMHTSWLHSEVQRLQSRVDPQYASLIAVDFLVRATRATVRRQRTLGLSLAAARPFMEDGSAGTTGAAAAGKTDGKQPAARASRAAASDGAGPVTTQRPAPPRGAAAASPGSLIPPNSAVLLWVRRNVERFACDVLATHLLSFGSGTDGSDPIRIRQAAQMIAQTSRVMQTLSSDGFAGCDTLIMRQLTPSLVILEDDFTRLTGERVEHGGRAMMEQLIMGSLAFYEAHVANMAAATSAATTAADGKAAQPAPRLYTPPYQPSRCDDVARKVRVRCQELVQLIRSLPLSGHSLLVQLLLAPASSSLFKNATSAGSAAQGTSSPSKPGPATRSCESASGATGGAAAYRTGGDCGATALLSKAGATSAAPPAASPTSLLFSTAPPPLSSERFRFLRYANGCSSTHVRLLQSLCGYVAALTGTDQLPAEVMASAAAQEQESTNSAAAMAMRVQQAECVAYLLTSAVVTESIDVVLCNLLSRMMVVLLRQRKALVRFLSSEAFLTHHRRVFPSAAAKSAVPDAPFFSDPASSPAWVLDSTLCMLSDVLGLGAWVSFFTRGGAMAHILADAQFGFRTQHLERVQREMPRLVQGWMCAALLLSADVTRANTVLAPPTTSVKASAPLTASGRGSSAPAPLLAPQQSLLFGSQPPDRVDGRSPTLWSKSSISFSAVAAAAATAAGATAAAAAKKASKAGADTASVLLSIPITSPSSATSLPAAAADKKDAVASPFFADAGVREERVMKLIMAFLNLKYSTPAGYTVHRYVVDSANASSDRGASAGLSGVWAIRSQLSSYPEFPIGEVREHRSDEVFLFHWCVQVSLHLLTFFQERLITPSYVMNQRAAEAQGGMASLSAGLPFPLKGCITPQEDTVLAGWCAGGGNYVTAVALLQFLVMRVLRDGLCRADTWSAVYGCPMAQWRSDEAVLRQQLFFFSLFAYLWAPLFTGGRTPRARAAVAGLSPSKEEALMSAYVVDGLPSLTVLEWMTCGGVLSPSTSADSVAAAMASAALATIPANLTAVDVLFSTEGTIHMSSGGGEGAGAGAGAAGATHTTTGGGAASWRAKGAGRGTTAPSAATGVSAASPGTPTNTMLAKRELFGSCASYIPDGPLRVLRHFFEEQLGESRAVRAITSDVMRTRVERAMAEINLLDFVDTSLGVGDEGESEDDATSSTATRSTAGTGSANRGPPSSQRVTLQNLRDLIAVYTVPLS
ncbi:conserved hypothetical protein [Leishmania mexicana MHOM/GT/2001/U1103]|uniref:Uncharacterized protein n=1 Tax=Leishmania mexicana (strain MHOM/GT/2001/U1103) TaxID=929439 RepID=E9AKT4_LEIMU|nr:conserved hypothetical protein [Leishmania mexicana MHOM/GT/2001/U1103]CBZ23536.1 conserved hypothetical protein [Leishmania mexicana MHOM/GT/2001/U1103]